MKMNIKLLISIKWKQEGSLKVTKGKNCGMSQEKYVTYNIIKDAFTQLLPRLF